MSGQTIAASLGSVRERIEDLLDGAWPELDRQVRHYLLDRPLLPHLSLPLAACAVAGGRPEQAAPISAACAFLLLASRWFDDVQDSDRSDGLWAAVGAGRASNMAAAALTLSWKVLTDDATVPNAAHRAFGEACLAMARGQDRDMVGGAATIDDYWEIIRLKTGAAYRFACGTGAMMATDSAGVLDLCSRYGEEVGLLLQILDDLEGAFMPSGKGDLALGKATLPVIFALSTDHPSRAELQRIVHDGQLAENRRRVLEILETVQARQFVVWAALQQRRRALQAVGRLEAGEGLREQGYQALVSFVDVGFADLDRLLDEVPTGDDSGRK